MQNHQSHDARSFEREKAPSNSVIQFNMVEFDGVAKLHANTVYDYSADGIGVVSHDPIPIGQSIQLTLSLNNQQYELIGCVRWCLEVDSIPTYHAGINIIADDSGDYALWLKFCRH